MRNPFLGEWLPLYAPDFINGDHVVWVKDYSEFCSWVSENGLPYKIAFDHDLGDGPTGYDAAKFVVEYCMDNDQELPCYTIQSSNPVGKANINGLFASYIKNK